MVTCTNDEHAYTAFVQKHKKHYHTALEREHTQIQSASREK